MCHHLLLGIPVTDQDHNDLRLGIDTKTISLLLILIIHLSTERLHGLYPDCRDYWKGTILKKYLSLQKAADTEKKKIKSPRTAGIKKRTRSQDYSWDFRFYGNLEAPKHTNSTVVLHNTFQILG